jgi:trans-aconitate 2-methyltransferase
MSASQSSESTQRTSDWSPDQYLLFSQARNRPIHDLISFLGPNFAPKHITDLGCGPGNSTEILSARFPAATITGVDSSPAMLAKARAAHPDTPFIRADVRTYVPDPQTDLLLSNAVFHWLRSADRIPTLTRLLRTLPQGGVLALQMPDNYHEPSHRAMRDTAASPGPWQEYFARLSASSGDDSNSNRPDLDEIEPVLAYYDALKPLCSVVEIWKTEYIHVLEDHGKIVEWVRGTGLQPFVNALPEGEVREGFVKAYREGLERVYEKAADGKVLLRYPRRFVVAVR